VSGGGPAARCRAVRRERRLRHRSGRVVDGHEAAVVEREAVDGHCRAIRSYQTKPSLRRSSRCCPSVPEPRQQYRTLRRRLSSPVLRFAVIYPPRQRHLKEDFQDSDHSVVHLECKFNPQSWSIGGFCGSTQRVPDGYGSDLSSTGRCQNAPAHCLHWLMLTGREANTVDITQPVDGLLPQRLCTVAKRTNPNVQ